MRGADRLILTKTDSIPAAHVADLVATLRTLNPLAEIGAAVAGQGVALPSAPGLALDLRVADTGPLSATMLPIPPCADWAAVSLWLSAVLHSHGDDIYRIKGDIRSPAGRLLIQTVRRSVQPPEILPEGQGINDELACIGRIDHPSNLRLSLSRYLA